MASYLVIGGAGGIGSAVMGSLLRDGHQVTATARDAAEHAAIAASHSDVSIRQLDLLCVEGIAVSLSDLGPLHGVVNCAAIAPAGPAETMPLRTVQDVVTVNYVANVAIAQAVLPQLRATMGRLVFVSSMAGRVAMPFLSAYSASKHALEGFADALRCEVSAQGVEIVLIEPGAVQTPMVDGQRRANADRLAALSSGEAARYGDFYRGFQAAVTQVGQGVGVSAEAVASVVITALTTAAPQTRYVIGADAEQLIEAGRGMQDRDRDAMLFAAMTAPI